MTQWLTTTAEFEAVAPEWQQALHRAGNTNPCLLPEYLLAWIHQFVSEGALRVFVLHHEGQLAGGLALYQTRWPALPACHVLRPVAAENAELTDAFFTVPRALFQQSLAEALAALPGWRFLYLPLIRDLLNEQEPAFGAGARVRLRGCGASAAIALDGDAAAYVATRPLSLQKNLRNRARRAQAAGGMHLEVTLGNTTAFMTRLLAHNAGKRHARRFPSRHSEADRERFQIAAAEALTRRGAALQFALQIGGAVAASAYCLREMDRLHLLWFSYDRQFHPFSPGNLLLYELINWCSQNGIRHVELYNDEGLHWKCEWGNRFTPMYRLHWFSPGWRGGALQQLHAVRSHREVRLASARQPAPPGRWWRPLRTEAPGTGAVKAALAWLRRQEHESGGIRVHSRHPRPYPEVTGYLIPTLLAHGEREFALRCARWLVHIQAPGGWFCDPDEGRPRLFDTAQALRGLLAASEQPEMARAAAAAANYICALAVEDGAGGFAAAAAEGTPATSLLYALPPLQEAAERLGVARYHEVAARCWTYYASLPTALDASVLTHFLGYETDALLALGDGDRARLVLMQLRDLQTSDGGLRGRAGVSWICMPGLAQCALGWVATGAHEAAQRARAWLERHQLPNGGFLGSVGRGASYFPEAAISWGAKFFLDLAQAVVL